ncbi:hypothetical protein E1B28_011198 [Marasmius oreades]|uniref:Uncharacterized protein n=1 Tax=Marasmius oreades TaxID=181124 RepID=A0A9P7UPB1_9AGAR|nr:uncharacterized protein E1B28_011198 [Marasmius oreades]KAG7089522.1 hypothetical protein E1B28_011198 [Marasmius oreades]
MALAQRLNELAASHAQGLLNDDEYRLLRQDVFQRFSDTTIIPVESHVIPLESHELPITTMELTGPDLPGKKQVEFAIVNGPKSELPFPGQPHTQPCAKQNAVAAGVAYIIRRATRGRKLSKESKSSYYESQDKSRTIIPRLLPRKSSDLISTRSGSDTVSSHSHSRKTSLSSRTFSPPLSPSSSTHPQRNASFSKVDVTTAITGDDIFEDGELNTTTDIRQAMSELVEEGRRLIDALNDLERSVITKAYRDRSSVQPPLAETIISANWPSTPLSPPRNLRSASTSKPSITNIISTSSSSQSGRTIASRSSALHSPSFLKTKNSSSSLNSATLYATESQRSQASRMQRPRLNRKGSMSSLLSSRSRSNSFLSVAKDALNSATSNRSTGHLPLTAVAGERQVRADVVRRPSVSDGMTRGRGGEDEIDPLVLDVRKRRKEVICRYEARLEYLRARLKGAELHEKLLKR